MTRPSLLSRLTSHIFGPEINRRVSLAVRALDDKRDYSLINDTGDRDRRPYDRSEVLADALDAWRLNPLARRIIDLTTEYIIGSGLEIFSDDPAVDQFLKDWWNHPLNRMEVRADELANELSRTGNLFPLLSTNASGMTFVRAIPAASIQDITTRDNDVEQPISFQPKPTNEISDPQPYIAYNANEDIPDPATKTFSPRMLHFAVNRPVGAKWGEPDIAPLLKWLSRYSSWLEDRVRLNHFRQVFLFIVKGKFASEEARAAREAALNATPPAAGSILVVDKDTEEWDVIHPKLDSFEAREDGLSIKRMIAVGSGNPLHFLAEPEESTRTTAESAGGPTFRHYQKRQRAFLWIIKDIARAALRRRAHYDRTLDPDAAINIVGPDISARDNASLAVASSSVIVAFARLHDAGLITDAELLRLAYKFAGEASDPQELLADAKKNPPTPLPPAVGTALPSRPAIDPDTGDIKDI